MRTIKNGTLLLLGLLIVALTDGCSSQAAAPAAETFSDPFAYCAAVGTIDTPDTRYTGEQVPDVIIDGFKQAAGLTESDESQDMFRQTTIWRCMDGQVVACNFGANLPCDSKADTATEPTQEMKDYCSQNPGADAIPMSVTGHATIYSWGCQDSTPAILEQVDQADAAGYLSRIWYALEPAQ
jgi:hypothetical protein